MDSSSDTTTIQREGNEVAIPSSDVESLKNEGNNLYRRGEYREAASIYTAAIELASDNSTKNSNLIARLFQNRALANIKIGNEDAALADAERAVEIDYTTIKAWHTCGRLRAKRGARLEAMDAAQMALDLEPDCREAIELLRSQLDSELEARFRMAPLAEQYMTLDLQSAMDQLESVVRGINKEKSTMNRLIIFYIRQLFQLNFSRQLSVNEEDAASELEALWYNYLGLLYNKSFEDRMARSCAYVSLHLFNRLPHTRVSSDKLAAFSNLHDSYTRGGPGTSHYAGSWVQRDLKLIPDIDSEYGIQMRFKLTDLWLSRGDYSRAIEELQKCLEACQKRNYPKLKSQTKEILSGHLREMGNFDASVLFAEKSLSFRGAIGVTGDYDTMRSIGYTRDTDEKLDLALRSSLPTQDGYVLKYLIGTLYWRKLQEQSRVNTGNYRNYVEESVLIQKTIEYLKEARDIADKTGSELRLLQVDFQLAKVYALQNIKDISNSNHLNNFFESLISRAIKFNSPDLGSIYLEYCEILLKRKELDKALAAALEAEKSFIGVIKTLKTEEEILTRRNREGQDKYCNKILQFCYVSILKPLDALLVAERGKTRDFNIISQEHSESKLTIEKIKEIASSTDSCIIVLSEIIHFLFCWVVLPKTNDSITFFTFPLYAGNLLGIESEPIAIENVSVRSTALLDKFRSFLLNDCKASTINSKQESKMFELVFRHIEPLLVSFNCKSLVLVPDGSQYNENFSNAMCITDNSLLITKYMISICPSISMIINTHSVAKETESNKALIIGDPLSNLPFAMEEATLLNSLFEGKTGWGHVVLAGTKAIKKEVLAELASCSLVHIAAHADDLSTDELQVLRGSIHLSSQSEAGAQVTGKVE